MITAILGLAVTLGAAEPNAKPTPKTVESTARQYRIQVYNTFRTQREEYDRRIVVGNSVWKSWINAGKQEEIQGQFIQWYEDALIASRAGNVADLPPTDTLPQVLVSAPADPALSLPATDDPLEQDATRDSFDLDSAIQVDQAPAPPKPFEPSATPPLSKTDSSQGTTTDAINALGRSLLESLKGQ